MSLPKFFMPVPCYYKTVKFTIPWTICWCHLTEVYRFGKKKHIIFSIFTYQWAKIAKSVNQSRFQWKLEFRSSYAIKLYDVSSLAKATSFHPNLKLSLEKSKEKIHFLYVVLKIKARRIVTDPYWKPKDGHQYLNHFMPCSSPKKANYISSNAPINLLTTNVPIIEKPVTWFGLQINWLVSIWCEHESLISY